ncbi:MAG: ABC transporter substrate-binding protein [Alphaproteobacteria bacterium]
MKRRDLLLWGAGLMAATTIAMPAWSQQAKMVTQGVTATEILLGAHMDLSGPVAAGMPSLRNGLLSRIDEVNDKGGIHGRKLRLLVEDDGYQPAKAVSAAQKLIGNDKVFAMISSFGTGTTLAANKSILDAGVPHLFPWSGVSGPFHASKNPLVFTHVFDYDWATKVGVAWAVKELKAKKVGVLYQDDAFGKLVLKGVNEALAKMNMKIEAEAPYKPGDVDFSSQIARLRAAGVDLVVLGTIVRETIGAYAEAKKAGWNVKMITSIPGRNDVITRIAKNQLDGLYGIGQWHIYTAANVPAANKAWFDAFAAKYKAPPDMTSMVAYGLMDWTVKALEAAGKDLTVEKFVKALQETKYKDPFGNPEVNLSNNNHAGPPYVMIDVVKGGQWTSVVPLVRE